MSDTAPAPHPGRGTGRIGVSEHTNTRPWPLAGARKDPWKHRLTWERCKNISAASGSADPQPVIAVADTGAKSREFEDMEPSWGFLAGDMGIDSGIGNGAAVFTPSSNSCSLGRTGISLSKIL